MGLNGLMLGFVTLDKFIYPIACIEYSFLYITDRLKLRYSKSQVKEKIIVEH